MIDAMANLLSYSATGVSNCVPEQQAEDHQLPIDPYEE